MRCPCCGAAELIHDTRDLLHTYKGETTTIPAVTGDFCPACGEVVLDREQGDRYSELLSVFQRQVNAAYVDPGVRGAMEQRTDLSFLVPTIAGRRSGAEIAQEMQRLWREHSGHSGGRKIQRDEAYEGR